LLDTICEAIKHEIAVPANLYASCRISSYISNSMQALEKLFRFRELQELPLNAST
jgi:hypothetical protein